MATLYEQKFRDVLTDMFQLNQAELDFGIYRIMNQKRQEIDNFLNIRLVPEVTKVLKANANQGADISAMENEVFLHLTKFFGRYYDGGDFISKRRYKDDTYAIPYSGEEVKLYWANADQYYIKTSEYFKNYAFILPECRRKVHFVLRDAETEQNNNKAANNMERRFALCTDNFIAIEEGELCIYFTYELMPKATKQEALIREAEVKLLPVISEQFADFAELTTAKAPTDKNRDRTLLMKHLQDYTAKNTFDYFIHKDLGGFLRRELDFYIKNEVMFLDDLDSDHIIGHLAQVKAVKQVGEKIITFLAQLEDFQKKLWLKKKFVVGCDYCITLDRIPHDLYPEITTNEAQRQEWVRLFAIDELEGYSVPLTLDFLTTNPFLVLDTKFFSVDFKHRLVGKMEHVDEDCNGLLINSENFQALELLQERYSNSLSCSYADPPYNAKSSEILYKNSFKHSSWISMMYDRIGLACNLLANSGASVIAIDENEFARLYKLLEDMYPYGVTTAISIVHNPAGVQGDNFSYSNEYAIYSFKNAKGVIGKTERSESSEESFRDWGGTCARKLAKNCFYPIYVKDGNIIGFGDVCSENYHPSGSNVINGDITEVYPIGDEGDERKWVFARDTVESIKDNLYAKLLNGKYTIKRIKTQTSYKTVWDDKRYYANIYGSKLLNGILGEKRFDFPKSLYSIQDCAYAINSVRREGGIVLDYFAGSGTTAHAMIELSRKKLCSPKYILCEMGKYFDFATKERTEKVIYSEDWKNGKPVSRKGISQCFKYLRLEQYEDTLNNLQTRNQQLAFKGENADFEESYLLSYMLDTETRGDLFNLQWFVHPFDIKLKITRDNELVETPVDMVETFNYLIGLEVETMRWPREGYCVVEGVTHTSQERTLVIWRDCEKVSNEALNSFFYHKQDYSIKDSEFDKIYVNGDNTLPNIRTDEEHWKVVLIEEEFKKRMFENKVLQELV